MNEYSEKWRCCLILSPNIRSTLVPMTSIPSSLMSSSPSIAGLTLSCSFPHFSYLWHALSMEVSLHLNPIIPLPLQKEICLVNVFSLQPPPHILNGYHSTPNQWTCTVIISKGCMKVTLPHKPETVWVSKMLAVLACGIIQ